MDASRDSRRSLTRAAAALRIGWVSGGRLAAVAVIAGLAGVFVAACIIEGCTLPYESGETVEVRIELDGDHPVATSWIEISLSANALPGDVADRGARLQMTLTEAPDVTLTLVPEGADQPLALISTRGVASLPLDLCQPDEPCTLRALAILEWTRPQPAVTLAPLLTVEGLVKVPHTKDQCGLPGDVVDVNADVPILRPAAAHDAVGAARHDATELVRHVTVRFGADVPVAPAAALTGDDAVIARGHLAITPDANPPGSGAPGTSVPGLWLRVTPDDGGPPVLDRAIQVVYPSLPADATFPLDASCARPCERGYWIQAAVYDPADHRFRGSRHRGLRLDVRCECVVGRAVRRARWLRRRGVGRGKRRAASGPARPARYRRSVPGRRLP